MVDENIYSRLKKIQILVCAHKKDPNIRNEYPYKAIQVGKALHSKEYFGYMSVGQRITLYNGRVEIILVKKIPVIQSGRHCIGGGKIFMILNIWDCVIIVGILI